MSIPCDDDAVIEAARKGDSEKLKELLAKEGNPNAVDSIGRTALMYACENGQVSSVNALLKAGAKHDAKHNDVWTALKFALVNGHADCVSALRRAGAPSLPRVPEVRETSSGWARSRIGDGSKFGWEIKP